MWQSLIQSARKSETSGASSDDDLQVCQHRHTAFACWSPTKSYEEELAEQRVARTFVVARAKIKLAAVAKEEYMAMMQ